MTFLADIAFFVEGLPATKKNASHRYATGKSSRDALKRAKQYQAKVRMAAITALVGEGLTDSDLPLFPDQWLSMRIIANYHSKLHHDVGNIPEIICDALQNHKVNGIKVPGICYKNDRQILDLHTTIFHDTEKKNPEGVSVSIAVFNGGYDGLIGGKEAERNQTGVREPEKKAVKKRPPATKREAALRRAGIAPSDD